MRHIPNIERAKQDTLARRWWNKNHTGPGDLTGAISFWIGADMPKGSLKDWLYSIEPPAGWHMLGPNRQMRDYGHYFHDLRNGWWDEWLK